MASRKVVVRTTPDMEEEEWEDALFTAKDNGQLFVHAQRNDSILAVYAPVGWIAAWYDHEG